MLKNQKYKILYIENGIGFGGAVTCLCGLLKKLNREEYSPIIISSHNDEATRRVIEETDATFLYIKRYRRKKLINDLILKPAQLGIGIKRVTLLLIFLVEGICRMPFLIRTLIIIKRNKTHIIHLNNNIATNIEGVIISRLLRIPCICHIRGPEYDSFEARFLARYVSYFISMSEYVKESLLKIGVFQKKIKVIYDSLDIDECLRKSRDINEGRLSQYKFGKYNVGLIACLVWWKGHKIFIRAVDILIKEKNLKECKFFIVGDVPDKKSKLKEELIDLVNKLALSDYIIFTGYQDNVYQFMNRMDIIVHTSTEPEPFGRVIIESMALEKPVIATKMGGPLEIIEDGVNGILIPANDPYILADTIFNLLKDNNRLKQISQEAEKTVRERFSLGNCIRDIEEIYEEILQ